MSANLSKEKINTGTAKGGRVYFVGAGGIGVSALAQWYLSEGWSVYGSDPHDSQETDALRSLGAAVVTEKKRKGTIPSHIDLLIYTIASPQDRLEEAELNDAKKKHIRMLTYPQAVGELTRRYTTITISGAHGKSTTTAMAACMLIEAGLDPTVIIGTKLKEFGGTNFRKGTSKYLVLEADEYRAAFLNYSPSFAIITNIDKEHLDFYKTFGGVKKAFAQFILRIHPDGVLIANGEDKNLLKLSQGIRMKKRFYSTKSLRRKSIKPLLRLPGRHNLSNALAVDALGASLGIKETVRKKALSEFSGTWRRFELRGSFRGALLYDDYGHHPTEINATLEGAREMYPDSRIWCVFQPHHRDRLERLFNDFTKAFRYADRIIILETYSVPGREEPGRIAAKNAGALHQKLAKKGNAKFAENHDKVLSILRQEILPGDVVIVMGADRNITKITDTLLRESIPKEALTALFRRS